MNDLYLFCGPSGSGKSTIARMLEKDGYSQVYSYTTRKQRNEEDKEHIFISEEEFKNLQNLVAYTYYNGKHYGATEQQVDEADIYVIDPQGIKELLQKYHGKHKTITIIYFETSVYTRINRMLDRHDSDMQIVSRLLQDEKFNWKHELLDIMYESPNNNVFFWSVDANGNADEVYKKVLNTIKLDEN